MIYYSPLQVMLHIFTFSLPTTEIIKVKEIIITAIVIFNFISSLLVDSCEESRFRSHWISSIGHAMSDNCTALFQSFLPSFTFQFIVYAINQKEIANHFQVFVHLYSLSWLSKKGDWNGIAPTRERSPRSLSLVTRTLLLLPLTREPSFPSHFPVTFIRTGTSCHVYPWVVAIYFQNHSSPLFTSLPVTLPVFGPPTAPLFLLEKNLRFRPRFGSCHQLLHSCCFPVWQLTYQDERQIAN